MANDGRLFGLIAVFCLAGGEISAQSLPSQPSVSSPGLASGVRIDQLSAYVGVLDVAASGFEGVRESRRSLSLSDAGWAADVGWYVPGPLGEAYIRYGTAYHGNWKHSAANGFDHHVSVGGGGKVGRHFDVKFEGWAGSVLQEYFLFAPSPDPAILEDSANFDQFTGPLSGAGPTGLEYAPFSLSLFGTRREAALAAVRLGYSRSTRADWDVRAEVERDLPARLQDSDSQSGVPFSGFTEGRIIGHFSYLLSRRSSFGVEASYANAYSRYGQLRVPYGSASVKHVLSPHWFTRLEAGVGAFTYMPRDGASRPVTTSYRAAASVGAKRAKDNFAVTIRREIGNGYGLDSSHSLAGDVAWEWLPSNGNWTTTASFGYERLTGGTLPVLQAWLTRAAMTRRLTRQTKLMLEGVYVRNSGQVAASAPYVTPRGARLSYVWAPEKASRR